MLNLVYVVTQVKSPHGFDMLGYRGIYTDIENAQQDLYEANQMPKAENGWPYWKIFVYDLKFKGIID